MECQLSVKRSNIKVIGRQSPPQYSGIMFTYGTWTKRRRLRCHLQTGLTTVRPNSPSMPDTLGNWTNRCISCRHSAPTNFLVKYSSTTTNRSSTVWTNHRMINTQSTVTVSHKAKHKRSQKNYEKLFFCRLQGALKTHNKHTKLFTITS